jgi:hypothetical protein
MMLSADGRMEAGISINKYDRLSLCFSPLAYSLLTWTNNQVLVDGSAQAKYLPHLRELVAGGGFEPPTFRL